MKYAMIKRPSDMVMNILRRKSYDQSIREKLENTAVDAIGMCQGTVIEIMVAGDIAEKTADVFACEINGSCPQHITCLAVIGSISAVDAAMEAIKASVDENVG